MIRILLSLFLFIVLTNPSQAQEERMQIPLPDLSTDVVPRPSGVRPLTLDEVLALGLTQNPTMRVALERIEQARATYDQQRSQKNPKLVLNDNTSLQPQRSINTSGLFNGARRPASFPERFVLVEPLTNQLHLSLQVLLTTFGKVENAIAAAFLQIDVESAAAEVDRLNLRYQIKEAFFNKLKADATVEVSRLNMQVTNQALEDSQALFERGVMSRYDTLQAEIEVTRSVETLAQNLTRVDQSAVSIGQVLAERRFFVQPIAPPPLEVSPEVQIESLENFALQHRPELKSIAYSRSVAQKLLDAAHGESLPELVLAANYQTAFGQSLSPVNVPSLTLQLQWQIFDGGYRKGRIREAQSVLNSIDATEREITNQILAQVEQLWLAFELTAYNLATAQKQLEATEEYYEMARQRYINGLATTLEVSDSLRDLVAARSRLVETQFDRDLAFARLEQALGADIPDRKLSNEFLNSFQPEETPE